jgi:hypothetical protein
MPLSLTDNGKINFYFHNGMMRERNIDNGDNLWRTSLAYIAYGDEALYNGMLKCQLWKAKNHVQFFRSTEQEDNNVSRDQITMFLAALAVRGKDVKKHINGIKWKISQKYSLTYDMWLWMQALKGGKISKMQFFLVQIPIIRAASLWNRTNFSKEKYPAYAVHLLAWQIYSLQSNSRLKWKLASMVVRMADEDNLLVRLLLGYKISKEELESIYPQNDFVWQRYKNNTSAILRPLTEEEAEFNTLDIDVLNYIYNKQ